MSNMGVGVKVNTAELDRMARSLKTNARRIATAVAFKMEAEMKQRALVDTGAMRSSIYVVTQEVDGYSSASSAAKANNPNAETSPLPKPSGNVVANVGPSVEYAPYIEYGTTRQAAKPFVIPSALSVAQDFNSGRTWEELFK